MTDALSRKAEPFDPDCTRCTRLANFLADVRAKHPDYFAAPVPSFGDADARLLIVGLAPGMHGANASGRPFTGDYAGILLYQSLFDTGLSNRPISEHVDDGLRLHGCRITNAVRCLPPQNKPETGEVATCNAYLADELLGMPTGGAILSLGKIAHDAVIKASGLKLSAYKFGHAARHALPGGLAMLDSYHCSRYNTQTKRLTSDMFYKVMQEAKHLAGL